MKRTLHTKIVAFGVIALTAIFAGCNKEEQTSVTTRTRVSRTVINDAPASGGTVSLAIETSGSWEVVVPSDVDWIAPQQGYASGIGESIIKLTLLPNQGLEREATITVKAAGVTIPVKIVQPIIVKTAIYSDDFGSEAVVADTPVADYTGWNISGDGSKEVTYSAQGACVSGNSGFDSQTPNNILFGLGTGEHFTISNIRKEAATTTLVNLMIYSDSDDYTDSRLRLSYSTVETPNSWIEVKVVRNIGSGWQAAVAVFTLSGSTSKINLRFDGVDVRMAKIELSGEGIVDMPQVTTDAVTEANISLTSAIVTGKYIYLGTGMVSECGIAYCAADASPQFFVHSAALMSVSGAPFTVSLSALAGSTTYNYKAYIKIGSRYYYGTSMSFSTKEATPAKVITISELRAKRLGVIDANEKIEGIVINDMSQSAFASNIVIVQNGTTPGSGIRICTNADNTFAVGTKLSVVLTGGKLADNYGLLHFTPAEDSQISSLGAASAPSATAIQPTQLASYQSMLVSIDNCQVSSSQLGKTMEGTTKVVTTSGATLGMFVGSTALFKGQLVPQGSGTLTGIAGYYDIMPRLTSEYASLSKSRFMIFGTPLFSAQSFNPNEAIVNGAITIPYEDASKAGSLSGISVTSSMAGITPVTNYTASYSAGSGNIVIPIEGTPTSTGKVTFTISGIANLLVSSCEGRVKVPSYAIGETITLDFSEAQKGQPINFSNGVMETVGVTTAISATAATATTDALIYFGTWATSTIPCGDIYWIATLNLEKALDGVLKIDYTTYGAGSAPKDWSMKYSTDKVNWSDDIGSYAAAIAAPGTSVEIQFKLPDTISADKIYFKIYPNSKVSISGGNVSATSTTANLRLIGGFRVTKIAD